MREENDVILIFSSVSAPFRGDYIGLRKNPLWKEVLTKNSLHKMDRFVVFADILNKINRSNGKVMDSQTHTFVAINLTQPTHL